MHFDCHITYGPIAYGIQIHISEPMEGWFSYRRSMGLSIVIIADNISLHNQINYLFEKHIRH